MIYKLWDGDITQTYYSLEEAAAGVPEYLAAHPEVSDSLNFTAYLSGRASATGYAEAIFRIEGATAILEYLQDAGYDPEDLDDLEV